MRGRKPIPSKLKILRGSPDKRPVPENEPRPRAELPECPPHLDDEARAEWGRIAPVLFEAGCLTLADRACLAAYCLCWSRWVNAEKKLAEDEPEVLKSKNGSYQNPWLAVANRAQADMKALAAEFGMTPSSRTRVKAAPKKSGDQFEDFLNAG